MLYRRFGRTELALPVFSCGGMRYQFQWQDAAWEKIPAASQSNLEAIIEKALELGVNHIETARGYGTSEMQLGQILSRYPREKLIVQTKVSPKEDPQEFIENWETSWRYLNLEYVDLLGIHGVNTPELLEYTLRPGGCLEQARRWQREGRVRFIGFSTHAPTPVIIKAIETGEFDYVNLHWYYIFQDNWPAIEAAARQDMGVFIISPSDKGGLLYKPSEKLTRLCAPLSPMVFNDLFCLSRPQVHTLSVGAARPTDFDEHLQTLAYLTDSADPGAVLNPIAAKLEAALTDTLGEEWVRTWRQGLPTLEETPDQINIPVILWLRNLALAYDLVEYGKMRYNLLGNGGHWFPGQPAKNIDPRRLQSCLQASPHRRSIPQILRETDQLLGGEERKRLSAS
ncbi:MAG: aldo/keto reductase [Cyanobacteria bacterium RI_101]|nr:aldo/keto reductase [Cyanobacteria bacterium RI_101]